MNIVTVLNVEIVSQSPIFIGDGLDLFLIDDETGKAYLPATSIAGSFRAYLKSIGENCNELFGEQSQKGKPFMSKVFISDAFADINDIDRRTGLRIDPERGSNVDGSKISRCYLSPGLKFDLMFEIYSDNAEKNSRLLEMLYKCLKALEKGYIRFGSNKSNGLGMFKISNPKETIFDLKDKVKWFEFLNNDYSQFTDIYDRIKEMPMDTGYVAFNVEGEFSTPVLIKSPESAEDKGVDYKSIKSGNKYIVPGSSFKGVLRSRIEKVANYFGSTNEAKALFGDYVSCYRKETNERNDKDKKKNKDNKNTLSRVFVSEAELSIDTKYQNKRYNRIRIDRFTGGVSKTALMSDIPIQGRTNFKVIFRKQQDKEKDDYAIGIIALALRDLGTENLVVGGGNGIGRGRFKANKMYIDDGNSVIEVDFNSKAVLKGEKLLDEYVSAVKSFMANKEGTI